LIGPETVGVGGASHVAHVRTSIMTSQIDTFGWTTGGDPDLLHKKRIAGGAFGDVHEVRVALTVAHN